MYRLRIVPLLLCVIRLTEAMSGVQGLGPCDRMGPDRKMEPFQGDFSNVLEWKFLPHASPDRFVYEQDES